MGHKNVHSDLNNSNNLFPLEPRKNLKSQKSNEIKKFRYIFIAGRNIFQQINIKLFMLRK